VVKKDKNKLQKENHKEIKKKMLLALIPNKHLDTAWNSWFNSVKDYRLREN